MVAIYNPTKSLKWNENSRNLGDPSIPCGYPERALAIIHHSGSINTSSTF
jgi:hypothetical protein